MNKKIFFPVLLLAATFTACSSDDDPSIDTSGKMTVVVSETPLIPEGDEARQMDVTRTAAATTTASLSEFSMNYMESKYDFTKSGSEWTSNTWPNVPNDQKVDFYAYNAGTFNWSAEDPFLSYTVEEDAFSQKDVLIATANTSYSDHGGKVPLTFKHACAAVKVNVFLSNTLQTKLGNSKLTVNSIVMRNVKKVGYYHYNSHSWTKENTLTFYTLTNGNFEVGTALVSLPCGYLFLIPQTLGEGAQFDVTYNTDKHAYIPLNGVIWEPGYEYTMNIKLTTSLIK